MAIVGLDPHRVINGSYGAVFHEGEWLSNYNKGSAKVEIKKAEMYLSGTRWARHKVVGLKGTGEIAGMKVTSRMIELNQPVADDRQVSVRTELVMRLDDPESWGVERIRLLNVMFDEIQLADWEANKETKDSQKFTFEGFELLDPIVES